MIQADRKWIEVFLDRADIDGEQQILSTSN